MKGTTETRWLVLCVDGRHSTVGRHTDPSEEEIVRFESTLQAQGLSGWLVLMNGRYYDARRRPSLMMVRPLGEPGQVWEEAVAAFEAIRRTAVRPGRGGTGDPKERKPEELWPR
jgi:hypothetical protein